MAWIGAYLLTIFFFFGSRAVVLGSAQEENTTQLPVIEGCGECGAYRCPEDAGKCLLGSVPDSCECCSGGVCAKLEGQSCWNSSIPQLPAKSRGEGRCANNYLCQLRTDLLAEDEPEAVCVCMEQSSACGNDDETYATPCTLHEDAMRQKNSSLKLQHLGPCLSRPWIVSPPKDVSTGFGRTVTLNCETKGFPVPDVFWEFHSASGRRVLKLPNEEHDATVRTSEGPESLMRTSWLQLARLYEQHVGTYHCIANNTIGEASTSAFVSLL